MLEILPEKRLRREIQRIGNLLYAHGREFQQRLRLRKHIGIDPFGSRTSACLLDDQRQILWRNAEPRRIIPHRTLRPEILGQLLEMNSFGLGGYVESTLPLALELGVEMLDSGDNVIKTEPVEQPIAAGTAEEPARTDLDVLLKLAEGADASDLSKMKMNFTVTSGGKSGEPVTEDSYLYVVLKVKVPGGITIDLSSLGEPENTDSENY